MSQLLIDSLARWELNGHLYASANEITEKGGALSAFIGMMSDVVIVPGELQRLSDEPVMLGGEDISEVYATADYLIPFRTLEVHLRAGERWKQADAPGPAMNTYLIYSPTTKLVKIGRSTNVAARLKALSTASGGALKLLGVLGKNIESALHRQYASCRVRGEWFRLEQAQIDAIISENNFILQ